ncbi:MAG: hypothetical protein WB586_08740 [Chthoniobacterales bacterium]
MFSHSSDSRQRSSLFASRRGCAKGKASVADLNDAEARSNNTKEPKNNGIKDTYRQRVMQKLVERDEENNIVYCPLDPMGSWEPRLLMPVSLPAANDRQQTIVFSPNTW